MKREAASLHSIHIRPATAADATRISDLLSSLSRQFIAHEFTDEGRERLLNSLTPAAIERLLEMGYRYFVAESGRSLAGVVATRDDRHLYHLFVAIEFQRQGLARRLWEFAQYDCAARSGSTEFTVNASRFALPAYERLGFVRVGEVQETGGVVSVPMKFSSSR
jgi:GNAT superfamily N-acetyltransferase